MPELPIWQFDVLLLILVVVFAVVALSIRNLMGAAVVFGAYSFMMCLIWAGMGAVDVAFTEAAVGAGVSTVFVVSTLYNTGATMQRRTGGMAFKLFIAVVVTLAGVFLLSALPDSVRVPRFIAETNTSDTETWRWINFQRPSLWSNMVRRRIISV